MSQETKSSILTQSRLKSFSCFILTINHFTAKSPQREGAVFAGVSLDINRPILLSRIFIINKNFYSSVPRQQCSPVTRQECSSVPRRVEEQRCFEIPRQSCQQVERQVAEESCSDVPRQQCGPVARQNCQSVPRQQCRSGPHYLYIFNHLTPHHFQCRGLQSQVSPSAQTAAVPAVSGHSQTAVLRPGLWLPVHHG